MRTPITLDDDIFRMAQALAAQSRTSLGAVLSRLARQGLARAYTEEDDLGLPVFGVSEDAPPFGPEEVARSEEEQ